MPSREHQRYRNAPASRKLASLPALTRVVRAAKARGRRVVFTNGCFDLLHAGHIQLLERARRLGDLLVVGINSDRSVRRLKGPSRPVMHQQDRVRILAALEPVSHVVIFHEPTPERVVRTLRPHVLVKGADLGAAHIVGREVVERDGGRVVRIPLVKGHSTSAFIRRIRQGRGVRP